MVAVNDTAPSFTLVDTQREKVSLSDYAGKKVVVAFFPAAFTGVCTKEFCTFQDSFARFQKLDAAIVGVSVDAPFANAAFAEKNGIQFPILSDYNREAVRAYGVAHDDFAGLEGYTAAKRSVFVVDGEGKVAYAWVAPNPGVEPDYAEVEAALQ